jgi:hypothetical protein
LGFEIDVDNVLKVGTYGCLEWCDGTDFAQAILSVASFADVLEDNLFGGDAN